MTKDEIIDMLRSQLAAMQEQNRQLQNVIGQHPGGVLIAEAHIGSVPQPQKDIEPSRQSNCSGAKAEWQRPSQSKVNH